MLPELSNSSIPFTHVQTAGDQISDSPLHLERHGYNEEEFVKVLILFSVLLVALSLSSLWKSCCLNSKTDKAIATADHSSDDAELGDLPCPNSRLTINANFDGHDADDAKSSNLVQQYNQCRVSVV